MDSGLTVKPVTHFVLVSAVKIGVPIHCPVCDYPAFLVPVMEETNLSPLRILGSLVKY